MINALTAIVVCLLLGDVVGLGTRKHYCHTVHVRTGYPWAARPNCCAPRSRFWTASCFGNTDRP